MRPEWPAIEFFQFAVLGSLPQSRLAIFRPRHGLVSLLLHHLDRSHRPEPHQKVFHGQALPSLAACGATIPMQYGSFRSPWLAVGPKHSCLTSARKRAMRHQTMFSMETAFGEAKVPSTGLCCRPQDEQCHKHREVTQCFSLPHCGQTNPFGHRSTPRNRIHASFEAYIASNSLRFLG